MKKIIQLIFCLTLLIAPSISHAEGCAEKAATLAESVNGEVVGVESIENTCKIKVRIPGENGQPPRVETTTLNK